MSQPYSKRSRVKRWDMSPVPWDFHTLNRRDPALVSGPVLVNLQNMIMRSWGLEPRPGLTKHNSTVVSGSPALYLFPFTKRFGSDPIHLIALGGDGKVYRSDSQPPTADDFTQIYNTGETGITKFGAMSVAGRFIITTDKTEPIIFYGNVFDPKAVFRDDADHTFEVTDGTSDNIMELDSLATSSYVYICSPVPLEKISVDVYETNSNVATLTVSYYGSSGWAAVAGLTDGTESPAGTSLGQDGNITFTAPTHIPSSLYKISGYWYRLGWSAALDASTSIAGITVYGDMNPMQDIPSNKWDLPAEVWHYDSSQTKYFDYTREVTDYVELDADAAVSHCPFAHDSGNDFLYIGAAVPFIGANFKLSTSYSLGGTITVKYKNNSGGWTNVPNLDDKTNGLDYSGNISWTLPTDWARTKVEGGQSLYFIRITVDSGEDLFCKITELRVKSSFSDFRKWRYCTAWNGRAVFFNRKAAENEVVISEEDMPETITGPDAQILPVGPREELLAGVPFYHELFLCSERSFYLLYNTTPPFAWREFGGAAEGTCAPHSVCSAQISEGEFVVLRQGRRGIYRFDGKSDRLVATKEFHPYFNRASSDAIKDSRLDDSWGWISKDDQGTYYNLLVSSGNSTTHNTLLVYDIINDVGYSYDLGKVTHSGCQILGSDGVEYVYFGGVGYAYKHSGTTDDGTNISYSFNLGSPIGPVGIEGEIDFIWIAFKPESVSTVITVTKYEDDDATGVNLETKDIQKASGEYVFHEFQAAVDARECVKFKVAAASGKKMSVFTAVCRLQSKRENVNP